MFDNDSDNKYKHIFLIDPLLLGIDFIEDEDLFNEYFDIMNYAFDKISKNINSKLNETLNTFPVELLEDYDNDKDFEYFNDLLKPFYNEVNDDLEFLNSITLKNIKENPNQINLCVDLDEPIIICKTYKSLDIYKFGKVIDLEVDKLKMYKLKMFKPAFGAVHHFLQKYDQCNIHIIPLVIWDPTIPIYKYILYR